MSFVKGRAPALNASVQAQVQGYMRDPYAFTRGAGAIASLDAVSGQRRAERAYANAISARRDQVLAQMSTSNARRRMMLGGFGSPIPTGPTTVIAPANQGWAGVLRNINTTVQAAAKTAAVPRTITVQANQGWAGVLRNINTTVQSAVKAAAPPRPAPTPIVGRTGIPIVYVPPRPMDPVLPPPGISPLPPIVNDPNTGNAVPATGTGAGSSGGGGGGGAGLPYDPTSGNTGIAPPDMDTALQPVPSDPSTTPAAPAASSAPAAASGLSTTTLLLGAAAVVGAWWFLKKKH